MIKQAKANKNQGSITNQGSIKIKIKNNSAVR